MTHFVYRQGALPHTPAALKKGDHACKLLKNAIAGLSRHAKTAKGGL